MVFEIGTTTAYELSQDSGDVAAGSGSQDFFDDWGAALTPGTSYHWRVTFTPTGGTAIYGADQTFTTTGQFTAVKSRSRETAGLSATAIDLLGRRLGGSKSGSGLELSSNPKSNSDIITIHLR
jgi:hypothetical protein